MSEREWDAIVVGGGIIGLSIAWRACLQGLSVTVLERERSPAGASWMAAGMLAPVTEATFGENDLLALNLEGARRWPGFLKELENCSGMKLERLEKGTLFVALDRDQAEALRRLYDYQESLGLEVAWLNSRACRQLEPALHPRARSAVLAEADGAVDPRDVIRGLASALRRAGVTVRRPACVVSVEPGEHAGVLLSDGEKVSGKCIVLAAGCWSGSIRGIPDHIRKALRPVKGQILRLRGQSNVRPLIRHVVRTEEVYLVPRPNGELVAGATVEEKGFDTTLTAGGVFELLRAADEVVPGIRELELVEAGAGLRPGTPDNMPLIGSCAPGLIVATGHYRNGVLQAPVTGDAVAHLLVDSKVPEEIASFNPSRFEP